MTATVIDGKAFAATVREKVAGHVDRLKSEHGITPGIGGCSGWRGSGKSGLCAIQGKADCRGRYALDRAQA